MKLEEITVIVGPTDEALAAAINQTSVSRRARRSLGMATLMTGRPSGRGAVQRRSPDQSRNPEVSTELAPHLTGPLTAVNLTIIDDSGKRVLDHVSVEMNLGKAWRSSVKATAAANIWRKHSAG